MNISQRLICKPSNWLVMLGIGVVAAGAFGLQTTPPHPRELPPFLEEFKSRKETPLIDQEIAFPSGVGKVHGYWARQDKREQLPAILVVYDDATWSEWMKINIRHFASIGYETLAVHVQQPKTPDAAFTDEVTLRKLSAAVRWLRGRSEVLPNRIGVVGWGWGGGQALVLASALSVQACIVCDAPLPSEPALFLGLRETPVLAVVAGKDKAGQAELPAFRKLLAAHRIPSRFHVVDDVETAFMGPPDKKSYSHDAAEDAWVVIYNFLETHVEDLRPAVASSVKPIATIADIMRSVNAPTGARGAIGKALEQEPADVRQWQRIRADAALMAEAGAWLQMRVPPKGSAGSWKEQAQAYTAAAEAIVSAADKHDFAAARAGLTDLKKRCAACHEAHR